MVTAPAGPDTLCGLEVTVSTSRSLGQLLLLANTLHNAYGHGQRALPEDLPRGEGYDHDHLAQARFLRVHLDEYDVNYPSAPLDARALRRLRALRSAVQSLVDRRSPQFRQASRHALGVARFALDTGGIISAEGGAWDAWASEVSLGLIELVRYGSRLKRCENPDCRWIYVDRSRSQNRRWCEMGSCGNRNKVRLFRRRQARSRRRARQTA